MGDDPEAAHERAVIQHIIRRLDRSARGVGLDEATTRQVVEKVVADMPLAQDDDRLALARNWMLIASA
ncbi:hypothetical protein ACLBX9_10280 [Methylobacterium sp. A49B]